MTMNRMWMLYYVVRALMMTPASQEVLLFGSSARRLRETQGEEVVGNDFDLIVTVDTVVYNDWNERVVSILQSDGCESTECPIPNDVYHSCKLERLSAALELLGAGTYKELTPLYGWLNTLDCVVSLDVHLMPQDWRDRIGEIQQHLPHQDPQFVHNIAADVVLLSNEGLGGFVDWEIALQRLLKPESGTLSAEFADLLL